MQYDEAEVEVRGGVAQPCATRLIYTGLLPCKQSTLTRVEAASCSTNARRSEFSSLRLQQCEVHAVD